MGIKIIGINCIRKIKEDGLMRIRREKNKGREGTDENNDDGKKWKWR